MTPEKQKLKLFVVGQSSENPDDWSEWSSNLLVVAESREAALRLSGCPLSWPAAEITMTTPVVLSGDLTRS
jgi:hypothetical protein